MLLLAHRRIGLGGAYFILVTGVTLWVSLDWLRSNDEPTFSGIWLTAVAPQADLVCWFVPGFSGLSGQPYLLGFYLVFVVEFLSIRWAIMRLRRRSSLGHG
jgi:hypothetical protein